MEYEPFWSCNGMGRRSCRDARPYTDGAGNAMQEEPGDIEGRILRVWVASFSRGLGLGFCVRVDAPSHVGARSWIALIGNLLL